MQEKKEETGVQTVTSVVSGIEIVNQKIEALKHIQDKVYRTSGKLDGFSNSIETETNVMELIKMFSSVLARKKAYDESQQILELTTVPEFKINGFSLDDYKQDIQLRIAIIENKERLEELTAIKKEYTELMDKDDRMALLTQKLAKLK